MTLSRTIIETKITVTYRFGVSKRKTIDRLLHLPYRYATKYGKKIIISNRKHRPFDLDTSKTIVFYSSQAIRRLNRIYDKHGYGLSVIFRWWSWWLLNVKLWVYKFTSEYRHINDQRHTHFLFGLTDKPCLFK